MSLDLDAHTHPDERANISESDLEDVLSLYWQMLRLIESRAGRKDFLDRDLVRSGYTVLNRIGFTVARPESEGGNTK